MKTEKKTLIHNFIGCTNEEADRCYKKPVFFTQTKSKDIHLKVTTLYVYKSYWANKQDIELKKTK